VDELTETPPALEYHDDDLHHHRVDEVMKPPPLLEYYNGGSHHHEINESYSTSRHYLEERGILVKGP
jgi:hypothetical protein